MTYPETLEYLYARLATFHRVGASAYKPGLENTTALMQELGNPHLQYKTIHLAGTNGKGSVSHLLAAILQESGLKVGLYTSPHLVDFGERIRVNGLMIDQNYVVHFVEKHQKLFDTINPSFFEATMAMAFQYFVNQQVDVAVIETGLGGRLDSTNIITPELSVITNISFDHVGFLGDTLEKIAFEKAGIIKPNTPIVIGESLKETKPIFMEKSMNLNAPISFAEDIYSAKCISRNNGKMLVSVNDSIQYEIGLTGNYQLKNLGTVLTSVLELRKMGYTIDDEALRSGLTNVGELTGLQGRWQTWQTNPQIILDTGHNKAGIEEIVKQLNDQSYRQLHFIIGMVNDKDVSAVLQLLPNNALYYFTQANIERALGVDILAEKAKDTGLLGKSFQSVETAIKKALESALNDDLIFIGGSNFVVGESISILRKLDNITTS
jgi:dihydrofolate synthase / folylpolyglutamate synthase